MGTTHSTVTSRVRAALNTLARHNVTEEQVRELSRLSPERWELFATGTATGTATIPANLDGIKLVELATLSDALVLDTTYLMNGDRAYSIRYSPCGLANLIASRYPSAAAPSTQEDFS